MKPKQLYIVAGVASLVALIGLGSTLSLSVKNKAAEAEILALRNQIVRMEASVPEVDAQPEIIYLNDTGDTNELAHLKAMIAEQEKLIASFQSSTNENARQREPRQSFEERMAQLKQEDPEAYAEMIKRREERQTSLRYGLAERTATFMDLDTSLMTEEELANHNLLVEKMARVWELTEAFQNPEAAPDRETMRNMFEAAQEARPLLRNERTVMFKQLGYDLGYEGEDAANLAANIENIIEATNIQMPFGGGRGGGRGDGRQRGGDGGAGGQ